MRYKENFKCLTITMRYKENFKCLTITLRYKENFKCLTIAMRYKENFNMHSNLSQVSSYKHLYCFIFPSWHPPNFSFLYGTSSLPWVQKMS